MYDDLIKKLRYCGNAVSCLNCPYWEGCAGSKEDLIKAADAIEKLKILADNGEATYEIMVRQTSYIEKLKQKIPHWIPVTERLPKYGTKVLVFAYGHDVLTARLCKEPENDYPVFDCNGIYSELAKQGRITHWMPLPEAPKEE